MKKLQIDQYDMILSVENHFDDNPVLWTGHAPLSDTKTLFSGKVNFLSEQVALQLLNPKGITIEKANTRTLLEKKAFQLISKVCGYAAISNKTELYKRVYCTKSQLSIFREAELLGVVTNLYQDALAELPNLVPYGVTEEILDSLNEHTTTFGRQMKKPTAAIAKRKSATLKIAALLPEIIEILDNRFDNLVVGLEEEQPLFVQVYKNVRALNSTGINPLSLTVLVLDSKTNLPVPNVNIEIASAGITRLSTQRGYNRVQNLVAGNHSLVAKHPNYETQTVKFTVVNSETTELVILFEKHGKQIPATES